MTTTVYLIGLPGAGKTTLMRGLTAYCARRYVERPVSHDVLLRAGTRVGVELGHNRQGRAGTDALAYNAAPVAAAWLEREAPALVLAEGDRLACATFLEAAQRAGRLVLVHLATPAPVAAVRRRAQLDRRPQAPAWLSGRATKVRRLAAEADVILDGTKVPRVLVAELHRAVPLLASLTPPGLRSAP